MAGVGIERGCQYISEQCFICGANCTRTSKTKKAKYLYLSRGTELEAQAVNDVVEWAQKAGLTKGDPFASRHKGGKRKKW